MGIFDELQELKDQLEKSGEEQEEKKAEEPEVEKEKEPEKEAEPEKPAEVEKPVEKPAEEEKPLDDNGFARLRRERDAEAKRAKALEDELAALKAKTPEADAIEPAPIPAEMQELIEDHRYHKAGLEFNSLEDGFRQKAPDYDDVANQYKQALAQSIRIQNPRMTVDDLVKATNKQLLTRASVLFNAGFDPIEEMYHEAKALGFKALPKQEEKPAVEEKKELKPDLDKIAANKARNAGTAAAKGMGGEGQMTASYAAELPAKEWARLPKAEKDRILAGLG